jgi:hypothetical protein
MKAKWVMILAACALGSLSSWASAGAPRFQFRKDIERPAASGEEIVAVVLDRDVFAVTREGFPDVRILDDRGAEVPYVLEQSIERIARRVREPCASEVVSLRELDGKALEIVVRLRERAPSAGGLTIVTPLSNFEHRLKVFGSRDGTQWWSLVADGLVFDYSRYMDVRSSDVELPGNDFRRFKLEIAQGLEQRESPFLELARSVNAGRPEQRLEIRQFENRPFRIDRIDLWRTVEQERIEKARKTFFPIDFFRIEQDPKEKTTRIDVRTSREPLTGFVLETSSRNFSRTVRVFVPVTQGVRTDWQELAHETVYRYQFRGFHKEDLTVGFAERRSESYRIVIENADNAPLDVTGVRAEADVYRLVFLAGDGRRFHLEYGSNVVEPPRYDTAAVLASLGPKLEAVETGLGKAIVDPEYTPGAGARNLLNSPIILLLALAVMIIVLAWALLRAGKQIKKLPEADV